MEQIEQIFNILKDTPETALWGLLIWCLYILAKLSSIVLALKIVFTLGINKYHDYKIRQIETNEEINSARLEQQHVKKLKFILDKEEDILKKTKELNAKEEKFKDLSKLYELLDSKIISKEENKILFYSLLTEIASSDYIHTSDLKKSIKILKENK